MSVRRANVRLWSLLPRLLLGAFALGACRDDSAGEPTVRHLDQGSVSGTIGETAFQRVVLVGHALGAIVALAEASTYHDVDGVVLSGISHFSPSTESALPSLAPVNQDPRFARRNLDDDYLTTPPGARQASFQVGPATDPDPQLLALDEATKETVTTAELRTAGAVLTSVASFAIRVPVLMGAGQFDPGVCGRAYICASLEASEAAFALAEAPFFAPDACLETVMIEDAGHYLNLEPTAPATFALIRAWSDAHVGLYQAAPPCNPGRMRSGGPRSSLALGRTGTPDDEALRLGA